MLTKEQLEKRYDSIGGSDAAAVLGMSKWATPYDVWLEKTTRQPRYFSEDAAERMEWGNLLEPVIREKLEGRFGKIELPDMLYHPEHEFIHANLDGLARIDGEDTVIEIKTTGNRDTFGDDSDDVPTAYYLQCQHNMIVSGTTRAKIAALICGQTLKIFDIELDKEIIDSVLTQYERFWQMVKEGKAPEPSNPVEASKFIRIVKGKTLVANEQLLELTAKFTSLKENISAFTKSEKELKRQIAELMGDAEIIADESGKTLLTYSQRSRTLVDGDKLRTLYPDIYKECLKTSEYKELRKK